MFDNDDPQHRQQLISLLQEKGINAFELNSGGWTMHVAVALIDSYSEPPVIEAQDPDTRKKVADRLAMLTEAVDFYLVTGSAASNCDIGFIGEDGSGNQISFPSWEHADALPFTALEDC